MICDSGLCDFAANLLFSLHQSDYFSPGAIHDQFTGAIKQKHVHFLGAPGCCLVDFGDFHAANRKNKNTKMCLPLERQAEKKRTTQLAPHFWMHSLGVLYGLERTM